MAPELTVLFSAMTPFVEMKLAIPLGIKLGLHGSTTFLFAVIGSMIPATLGLAVATPVSSFLRRHSKIMDRFLEKLFHKTRHHHSKRFKRNGAMIIIALVAIPLPGSGSSVGALIAFVFGVNYWKAIGLIAAGTAIGAILLLAGFGSVFKLLDIFT